MTLVRVYCGLASAEPVDAPPPATGTWLTVAVVDDSGRLLDICDISDDAAGYAELGALLAERSSGPASVAVAADSDDHVVTQLLTAAGRYLAYTDDDSAEDYAERFADDESAEEIQSSPAERRAVGLARALQAGVLSAVAQAAPRDMLALKPVLAAHAAVTTGRQGAAATLREVLRELYPAALRAFPDPAEPVPLAVLDALPEPALLGTGNAGRSREAQVAAELAHAGVADGVTIAEAITALRVAIAETPRRAGLNRSVTAAVAETIRQAAASVRACDAAAAALVAVLAERMGAGTRSAPARGRTPSSPPPAPAPLRAVRQAAEATRPAGGRRAARTAVAEPVSAAPAARASSRSTRREATVLPTRTPVEPHEFEPPIEPAALLHPVPVSAPPLPVRQVSAPPNPISAPPRPVSGPPESISAPPLPISAPPLATSLPPLPTSAPPMPTSLPSRPMSAPPAGPYASPDAPTSAPPLPRRTVTVPPLSQRRGAPAANHASAPPSSLRPDGPFATSESPSLAPGPMPMPPTFAPGPVPEPPSFDELPVTSAPPMATVPVSAAPLATGYLPDAGDVHRFASVTAYTNGNGAQMPRPAPDVPPPGTRASWPLRGQEDDAPDGSGYAAGRGGSANGERSRGLDEPVHVPALDRLSSFGDPLGLSADEVAGPDGVRPREGRVTPPWQADDLPAEPPALRLVEPAPMADPALASRRGTSTEERDGELRFEPPALRLVEANGSERPTSRGRRAAPEPSARVSADTAGTAGMTGTADTAAPAAEVDGDLLIFTATRSAWFTDRVEEEAQVDWATPADAGWRAAEQLARPAVGAETSSGLPRRVPQQNLVPGSPISGGGRPLRIVRDAASIAANTTGYFRGWRRGQEVGGYAVGGRPGRESAGGWNFNREQAAERDYEYHAAGRR